MLEPGMEHDARPWIVALRHSHDALAGLVAPLGPDQLGLRSYCTEWTVARVLSHLGSGAEIALLSLRAALAGDPPLDPESFPPIWDRWNAKSPEVQASDALAVDEDLVAALEGLDDAELDSLHVPLFGMEFDAAGLVGLRLGEHALHTWDVAVSLDPAARVLPGSVELLIDRVPLLAGFVGQPSKAGVGPSRVAVHTTESERQFLLEIGDRVTVSPAVESPVDATVELPAEALLRLIYGRLDPETTPALQFTGGPPDLDDLRRVFPGF
jgi:uncharacterized protein (TIGR03083 family)